MSTQPQPFILVGELGPLCLLAERRIELCFDETDQTIRVLVNGVQEPVTQVQYLGRGRLRGQYQFRIRLANGEVFRLHEWRAASKDQAEQLLKRALTRADFAPTQPLPTPLEVERANRVYDFDE